MRRFASADRCGKAPTLRAGIGSHDPQAKQWCRRIEQIQLGGRGGAYLHDAPALLITHDLAEAVTLSDRVLVMSQRPGTIIDEIAIELPQRDNPMARRRDARFGDYVAQLMDRLDIAHASL
jgi:hypothetical protein